MIDEEARTKLRQLRHLIRNGSYAYPAGGHEAMKLFDELEGFLAAAAPSAAPGVEEG